MAHQENEREVPRKGVPASLFTRHGRARLRRWRPSVNTPFAPGGDTHIQMPLHMLMAEYLSQGTKLVYGLIRFCARGKAWANPSLTTLSRGTGLALSGVQRAIQALSTCGYIRPVKTDQDRSDLKDLMHKYYDFRKEPEGYKKELERLGLSRQDDKLGASIYMLVWNKYWDLARQWHASESEEDRQALMDYLRYGLPEHRKTRKPQGTVVVQQVQPPEAVPTQAVAPVPAPRPSEEPLVAAGQGSTIASANDRETVEAFAKERIRDLFGFDKIITPEEHAAIEQALSRVDKKGRRLDATQLQALIGWYLQDKTWLVKMLPPSARPAMYERLSLIDACAESMEAECRTALQSLLRRTMGVSRGNMTEQELAQARLKYLRDGLKRAGVDVVLDAYAPIMLDNYIQKRKERDGRHAS